MSASGISANCVDCGAGAGDDFSARFVCPACGHPQPAPAPSRSYFEALGVSERFAQDVKELERRFFRVSRALHPDRFSRQGNPVLLERSQERMAFLNQAYRTLTDRTALRRYLLARAGFDAEGAKPASGSAAANGNKARIPLELAEEWFELQEVVLEAPNTPEGVVQARDRLAAFAKRLAERRLSIEAAMTAIEARADAAWADGRDAKGPLGELHASGHELSYLASMERDVARLKAKFDAAGGSSP